MDHYMPLPHTIACRRGDPYTCLRMVLDHAEGLLDFVVEDENHGGTDGTEHVGTSTLEKSGGAFVLDDLGEAIGGTTVQPLFLGGTRLHLETTTDGVEGVRNLGTGNDGELSDEELGDDAKDAVTVGVHGVHGVEKTELGTTVGDNAYNRHTETTVDSANTTVFGSLGDAVNEAVELTGLADVGSETGTSKVKRVDEAEGEGSSGTTRGGVHGEGGAEVSLGGVFGELTLDGVLEGKVACLGGEVTKYVHGVTTPEGANALLGGHTGEAVDDTSVTGDFAANDFWVGILGLDEELYTLDGCSHRLGDCTGNATSEEVEHEVRLRRDDLLLRLLCGHGTEILYFVD